VGDCGFEHFDITLGIDLQCPFSLLLTGRDRSAREGKGGQDNDISTYEMRVVWCCLVALGV